MTEVHIANEQIVLYEFKLLALLLKLSFFFSSLMFSEYIIQCEYNINIITLHKSFAHLNTVTQI